MSGVVSSLGANNLISIAGSTVGSSFVFLTLMKFFFGHFCFALQVVPLASVIVKEALTDEDILNCQKTIYNLVDMERKNDPLPISTVGTRGKGPKRFKNYLRSTFTKIVSQLHMKLVF